MSKSFAHEADLPKEIIETYRVCDGVYALGMLERGVTVYKQQVRAHNLIWALTEIESKNGAIPTSIAIIGGGIAGLTLAACCLSQYPQTTRIDVFEKLWDLCPLQQGSDNRWLHPRIYDWPIPGSEAPHANLPVLNWQAGRASEVAHSVLQQFGEFAERFDKDQSRLRVYLGIRHLQIDAAKKQITWAAARAIRDGLYFRLGEPEGGCTQISTIFIASGFGIEKQNESYPSPSYWRNEQLGQPILDGTQHRFLISGFGDGALIDLCRLTIERFRQDTIIDEILGEEKVAVADQIYSDWDQLDGANIYRYLSSADWITAACGRLKGRIRKDTSVVLQIGGAKSKVKTLEGIFAASSSFLSRMLAFLLFRCGAYHISFDDLPTTCKKFGIPKGNVFCRHGCDPLENTLSVFSSPELVRSRLSQISKRQMQNPMPLFGIGSFQIPT